MIAAALRERLAIGAVTVAGALLAPLPWHAAPVMLILAALSRRHRLFGTLGLVVAWSPAAGPAFVAACVAAGLLARRNLGVAVGILAVTAVLAAKQAVATTVLPAAVSVVVPLCLTGLVAASAVATGEGAGLVLAAILTLGRLGWAWSLDGPERVERIAELRAMPLAYGALVADADPATLAALVEAEPARDDAALRLGWRDALRRGWRPHRADGVAVEVARALHDAGRGGEAIRLLRRHPREGEVDALLALYERIAGEPVRWRGARLGPTLPGEFDPGVRMNADGYARVDFTALSAVEVRLRGTGSTFEGAPVLEIALDAGAPRAWSLDGDSELALGPVEAGPHRVGIRYATDRHGAGGDRNVVVHGVSGFARLPE